MNDIKFKGTTDEQGNYKAELKVNIYSAYDKIGETYLPLFMANTDMRAIRMLEDTVNDKSTPIGKHPEDYRLDKIGVMNLRTGEITSNEIRTIMEASEYGK